MDSRGAEVLGFRVLVPFWRQAIELQWRQGEDEKPIARRVATSDAD